MTEQEICNIFSNRIYEICLLKNIKLEDLISKYSETFDKTWLTDCFNGTTMPNDTLVVYLSRYFNVDVNTFFEIGDRITDRHIIEAVIKNRKIKHLEKILHKNIVYPENQYVSIIKENVKEALDKELISLSYAAYLLDITVEQVRKTI